ncbi:MAG: HD domain-containing protein [Bacteroidetes bacterium]|jgi:uncharacterized protein|nr:HD domain-containing protein [Bacteroidota bacterium]
MDLLRFKEDIIQLITNHSSASNIYHSVFHTLDVLNAVDNLIPHFDLDNETAFLIQTSALLHETGMTRSRTAHEAASVEIAEELLPDYGFSAVQIKRISAMILATTMPQRPESLEAQILCDADLDYLGRDDYFIISHKLRLEWIKTENYTQDLKKWYMFQQDFLSNHKYFTAAARSLRHKGKVQNLQLVCNLVDSINAKNQPE